MTEQPKHSPLGASSSERWMNCPGSIALLEKLGAELQFDDPDYRREGAAAHEAAAYCLLNDLDSWEIAGQAFYETTLDVLALRAIQTYLDTVRALPKGQERLVEYSMTNSLHPLYYGTVDCAILDGTTLYVNDYKHGEGIEVDVEWNSQVMYYGYGLLEKFPGVARLEFRIIQPRTFSRDAVQSWSCDRDTLELWAREILLPAMLRTEFDDTLDPGAWCRFCPAKAICPALRGISRLLAMADVKSARNLTDDELGEYYKMIQPATFFAKAIKELAFARNMGGHEVPNTKLVHGKTNRVWKAGAEARFKDEFGSKVYTKPEFLSPAAAEAELGEAGATLVHEWAYQPEGALTVALATDKKAGVKMKSPKDTFTAAVAALGETE